MRRDVILARGVRVDEHTTTIDGAPVLYRSARPEAHRDVPVVYLHDALMSSDDLVPFLERTGGVAPDLIGFFFYVKGCNVYYTPAGLVDFTRAFLEHLGIERARLAGHGWGGALALLLSLSQPELLERLVLINPVPLLPGFTWHRAARLWRAPMAGELAMGATPRWLLARGIRRGSVRPDAWSSRRLRAVWDQFDHGTQRALIRLHRAAGESQLTALGGELGRVTGPTLVAWGDADPWFDLEVADAYGARLANVTVEHFAEAGHWPWLDQPLVLERVANFLNRP